jgi:hypothetical protein
LNAAEVLGDFLRVALTLGNPASHEGIVSHQRRNKSRLEQVALDFRVNIVAGQR